MSRTAELLVGAVLLAFAGTLLFWLIPSYVGPGDQAILPKFVAISIALLSAALVVARFLMVGGNATHDDPFIETGGGEPLVVFILAGIWCGFIILSGILGFYIGGGLAMLISFLVLGIRSPIAIVCWIFGTLLLVYIVFERLMMLRLERGFLETLLGL